MRPEGEAQAQNRKGSVVLNPAISMQQKMMQLSAFEAGRGHAPEEEKRGARQGPLRLKRAASMEEGSSASLGGVLHRGTIYQKVSKIEDQEGPVPPASGCVAAPNALIFRQGLAISRCSQRQDFSQSARPGEMWHRNPRGRAVVGEIAMLRQLTFVP